MVDFQLRTILKKRKAKTPRPSAGLLGEDLRADRLDGRPAARLPTAVASAAERGVRVAVLTSRSLRANHRVSPERPIGLSHVLSP